MTRLALAGDLLWELLPLVLGFVVGWLARQWSRDGYVQVGSWRHPAAEPREMRADDAFPSEPPTSTYPSLPASGSPGTHPWSPPAPRNDVDERGGYEQLSRDLRSLTNSLEKQSTQLGALRADFKARLEGIEDALRGIDGKPAPPAGPEFRGSDASRFRTETAAGGGRTEGSSPVLTAEAGGGQADAGSDGWLRGVETYSVPMLELGGGTPAVSPASDGVPVEVREGMVIRSHSLPPVAYAVPEGKGSARVFLNESVEINEFALPKWQAFFEMRGARPYATYRTVRAAEVAWDGERGAPRTPGVAEAV